MGLSSSQARLLNLTARMHQIEYKAARLEAMKLQMANESRRVYEDYLDALDKTKVQKKTINEDGSLTYVDVSSYDDLMKAGYVLVVHGASSTQTGTSGTPQTLDYTVCTSKTELDDAVKKIYKDENGNDLDISGITSGAKFKTLLENLINSGDVTLLQGTKATAATNADYHYVSAVGYEFPKGTNTNSFSDAETSISTNTGLQEVTDEIALKKAEAKYEADMKRIDMKDRKYDTDLSALESERNAIKQEMDTLKTVSNDNVERTFKLFS